MKHKYEIMLSLLLVIFTSTVMAQKSDSKTADGIQHKVVIQLSSSDSLVWKSLMNNIKHIKDGWGESVQVEVVAYSAGLDMLMTTKSTQQKKIADFMKMGVTFVGCENTMRLRKIDKKEIIADVGFVPMGIGELILKQEQGWSYFKAGN